MTDPRSLSPDQRELLDAFEQVALLPEPIQEYPFVDLADQALTLMEDRGKALRDEPRVTLDALARYRAGFLKDGHQLAAEGVNRIIERFFLEVADLAGKQAPLN